jgi:hypothetical protein
MEDERGLLEVLPVAPVQQGYLLEVEHLGEFDSHDWDGH